MYTKKPKKSKPKRLLFEENFLSQIVYCDYTIEKGRKEAKHFRDKLSRNVGKELSLLLFVFLVEKNLQPTSFK